MTAEEVPSEGELARVERTFTRNEVEAFADLSRDRGAHHLNPDDQGRVLVHGLLLATLPTEIGGERNVLAGSMEYEFHRPVHSGELVVCEVVTEQVTERDDRYEVQSNATCTVDGQTVMTATHAGAVMKTDTGL